MVNNSYMIVGALEGPGLAKRHTLRDTSCDGGAAINNTEPGLKISGAEQLESKDSHSKPSKIKLATKFEWHQGFNTLGGRIRLYTYNCDSKSRD